MALSDAILTRLLSLHPKIIDLSLGRMHDILAKLGNPERKLPPVIHVAGTNGRGPAGAYLRPILQAAGRKVPTAWRLRLADRGLDVQLQAMNPKAWMATTVPCWEGPVTISGSHNGRGYLEMTGY